MEEESPRKVYVNSPIFTEEDAQTFQYVNPDLDEFLEDEVGVEDPIPLHVNRKQGPNYYDQQQFADDNDLKENDRDPPTLFRSSDWQFVVRKPEEKQTRKVIQSNGSKQMYDDEAAERLEMEERTQSHRDEVMRNNIPNLDLVDSGDDAAPADSLDLEISDGHHVNKPKHPADKLKHPTNKPKHPAGKPKNPANYPPIRKEEFLRDSLEDGDRDYQDDDREAVTLSHDSQEDSRVQEIFQNGYYLHENKANHRKSITASNGSNKPTWNRHAPSQNQKTVVVHQYQPQNWIGGSGRSEDGPPTNHRVHGQAKLSSVQEHSRGENHSYADTAFTHNPQNNHHPQQNHRNTAGDSSIHRPLPSNANSFEAGNQASRGLPLTKPLSSLPEKNFVEGNKQLVTKPPKTKKTYGEIYSKKRGQENVNTALPSYVNTDRRKVASADNVNSLQCSYESDNHVAHEERNSHRGHSGPAAEHMWQARAENLAKRKASGQGGKTSIPSGLRKYPSESKMDLKRSDRNEIRSKAINGGGSAPYLSRNPPHHLDPLQQQQQLQQQQVQQQLQQQQVQQHQWVPTENPVFPNDMYVQDAAQQQLQQLQQHQLLLKQQQQQYQQQLLQQQLQQNQEQQQQLHQHMQKQQQQKQHLQQQQLQQQQLQQQQLQQQQLQQQQLQQQQLQQQHLYQQQQLKQQELQQQLRMQQPVPVQQLKQQQPLQLQHQQLLLQHANPIYGATGDPVQHIITTEDGRKVSVDINLKVLKPVSQAPTIPIQPGLQADHFPGQPQLPFGGGYPTTVFQPVAGQVFQEVLPGYPYAPISAPVVLNTGSHQVVGQQQLYGRLPEGNPANAMSQTGLPQSYGYALPVTSTKVEQSVQQPPTKHPLSPFRVLPPVAQPQSKTDKRQRHTEQMVPPLKFNDQTTAGKGLDEGAGGGRGGGYMEQYKKQKNRQQDYKQYTLDDYRKLQKEAKLSSLGNLGPDVDSENHREKKEKAFRQQEYARQIKERNRLELEQQQRQKQSGDPLSPASVNEQSEVKAKRAIALDYAKNVPKPQTVIRSAESKLATGGKKQSIRNSELPQPRHHPKQEAGFWKQPPQQTTTDLDIDFDELQKLRERHELERQRLEMLLQNGHILPQNA